MRGRGARRVRPRPRRRRRAPARPAPPLCLGAARGPSPGPAPRPPARPGLARSRLGSPGPSRAGASERLAASPRAGRAQAQPRKFRQHFPPLFPSEEACPRAAVLAGRWEMGRPGVARSSPESGESAAVLAAPGAPPISAVTARGEVGRPPGKCAGAAGLRPGGGLHSAPPPAPETATDTSWHSFSNTGRVFS